jgi:hypothetical protein
MELEQRKITVFTPGKKYSGYIDISNDSLRTTDLLNSSVLFWRDPGEKCFENALMMHDVTISIDEIKEFKKLDKVQIRLAEVIFFYDDFKELGNEKEKIRASVLKEKTKEVTSVINIITKVRVNSFFDIRGNFHGLFKAKSQQRYVPLSNAMIEEIIRREGKWVKKSLVLPNNFIGVSTSYIESCVVDLL